MCGDTGEDKIDEVFTETKQSKGIENCAPFDLIKALDVSSLMAISPCFFSLIGWSELSCVL